MKRFELVVGIVFTVIATVSFVGCSDDNPVTGLGPVTDMGNMSLTENEVSETSVPSGLVSVPWQGKHMNFWPYTGTDFSGTPQDPINLVLVGKVDPVQIRAALMALDGDRSAFGLPNVAPLNGTWSDAIGNTQTGYVEARGWRGAVVQLQLGDYAPVRFHLRLIRGRGTFRRHDGWTIANAHFEITIPGTADHQVIGWEVAEQMVVIDLIRSGLIDPASMPPQQTGVINAAGSWHEIPAVIYNGIPDELKVLAGLPPGPTIVPVPIPTDGQATIVHLTGAANVEAGTTVADFDVQFDQAVPMPFCSEGPLDFVYAQGLLHLNKTVRVDRFGRYQYTSEITGNLTAVPINVTVNPPAPTGNPFEAFVSDRQRGFIGRQASRLTFQSERVAPQEEGTETLLVQMRVSSPGRAKYKEQTECISQ